MALSRRWPNPAPTGTTRTNALRVATFVALSLALAIATVAAGVPASMVPFVLALGPTVIAFGLAAREGNGAARRLARSAIRRPTHRAWYLAILLPVGWALATIALAILAGAPTAGLFDGVVPAIFIVPLVVLLPAFAEELSWRGYAVERLLPAMTPLAAALVLALPWALLHVLLELPGQMNAGLAIGPTVVSITAYSVVLTWAYVGSGGSVLIPALIHAGLNGVVPLMSGIDPELAWLLRAVVAGLIATAVAVSAISRRRVAPAA